MLSLFFVGRHENRLIHCFSFLQEALESGKAPAKSGGFSFKGLSSMIFGAESSEVLTAKIGALDEQIIDAEETVKTTKEDLRFVVKFIIKRRQLLNTGG